MPRKSDYTREELIALCEAGLVTEDKWRDRDTEKAQRQLGECWALLRAGCRFEVLYEKGRLGLHTDSRTVWVKTWSKGFAHFDWGGPLETENHYLPTRKRLAEAAGKDWY